MNETGLPAFRTTLVARQEEARLIRRRLIGDAGRLVTITGPGGVGKTRLAAAVAVEAASDFPDGVRFVALESATNGHGLVLAIARALRVAHGASDDLLREVQLFLADRRMLLVLDNFERLIPSAGIVEHLLDAAPGLSVLVTSREALNLQDEWRVPLSGLASPQGNRELTGSPAAALFIERVRQLRPDFDPAPEADAIRRICWTLDGLPLGLELAASWANTLSLQEIADELERDLDSLAARTRNVPPRHRQLRTVFEHSWRTLDADQQVAFRALGVMPGSFSAAALPAVGVDREALAALADKSLVQRRADGRFELPGVLRQYAAEALADAGEADARRAQHGAYYLAFLARHAGAPRDGNETGAIDAVDAELHNVLAAWDWGVRSGRLRDWPLAPFALHRFYQFRSRYLEAATLIDETLGHLSTRGDVSAADAPILHSLHVVAAWLALRRGRLASAHHHLDTARELEEALGVAPQRGTEFGTDPWLALGFLALTEGRYDDAETAGVAARAAADGADDGPNAMMALHILGSAAMARGALDQAAACAGAGLQLALDLGQDWFRGYLLQLSAAIAQERGDDRLAAAHFEEMYEIRERYHDREGMALALTGRGELARRRDAPDEAEQHLRRSLALYHDLGDRGGLARTLCGLGRTATARGDLRAAAERFRRALETALDIASEPLAAEVLAAMGDALLAPANPEAATELFAFLETHAASPEPLRAWAAHEREVASTALPSRLAREATRRGRHRSFAEITDAARQAAQRAAGAPTPPASVPGPLTRREMEILELMARGLSNPRIAQELGVSAGTIKWHAAQIFAKLEVPGRTAAAARARELGLLA